MHNCCVKMAGMTQREAHSGPLPAEMQAAAAFAAPDKALYVGYPPRPRAPWP